MKDEEIDNLKDEIEELKEKIKELDNHCKANKQGLHSQRELINDLTERITKIEGDWNKSKIQTKRKD